MNKCFQILGQGGDTCLKIPFGFFLFSLDSPFSIFYGMVSQISVKSLIIGVNKCLVWHEALKHLTIARCITQVWFLPFCGAFSDMQTLDLEAPTAGLS